MPGLKTIKIKLIKNKRKYKLETALINFFAFSISAQHMLIKSSEPRVGYTVENHLRTLPSFIIVEINIAVENAKNTNSIPVL